MAKKNDRKQRPHSSQPTFSVPPAAAAVRNPPPSAPAVSNPAVKGKGKAKARTWAESSTPTSIAEVAPQLLNPLSVRLQAPVRWIYNYDHTDPLNFGFMFPLEPGSSTDFLSNHSVTSPVSATTYGSTETPVLVVNDSPQPSIASQQQWDLTSPAAQHGQQHFVQSDEQSLLSASHQGHFPLHQSNPYQYSLHHDLPTASTQQLIGPSEEQIWFLPPHGTSVPEEFQDSVPHSRGWLLDGGSNFVFQPQTGPVSSVPLHTHHPAAIAPAPLKRKRSSRDSFSPTTPNLHVVAERRKFTLCSRCNVNEKLSSFPGLCSSCLQVSFTAWPSASGSRNENLESLVLFLLPSNTEDVLISAPPNLPRSRPWRILAKNDRKEHDFSTLDFQDRWTLSKQQAESTGMYGEDYAELANIARFYQNSLARPIKALESSCTALITVCQLYKSMVEIPSNTVPQTIYIPKLLNNIRTARITFRHVLQQIQLLVVSPSSSRDRRDWFAAFLSAAIMAVTATIFLDVMVVCPSPYREQIWGAQWHDRIVKMRNGGYGMLVALLKAHSNGVNPLKMECWTSEAASTSFINVTPDSYSPEQTSPGTSHGKKRRKGNKVDSEKARQRSIEIDAQQERDILLGIDSPAALQGMLALKAWYFKYHNHLKMGEDMFSKSLFMLATMKPIAGLWRIFELE